MKKWLALLALILAYTPVYAQAPTWTLGTLGVARNVTPNQIGVNIGTSSADFIPIGTVSGGVFAIGAIPFSSITNTSTQLFGTSNIWTAYQDFSATYIGSGYAASRIGGWVNNIWAGSQYQVISPIFAASVPTGGGAATFAARMSDTVGGGFGSIQVDRCLAYVDANPSVYPSWCRYTEGRTESGTTGWHINEESSIDNRWASPAIDPYAVNPLNGTRNLRLDCGIGSGSPTKCSDALEIVNNGATYYNGIVFSDDALDTSSGRIAPALALAKNHSVAWYYGTHGTPGSQSWLLYANATAPGGTIVLGNSAFNILGTGAEASTTFLYLSNTGAGLFAAGRSDGNQATLTGAASGSTPSLSATGVNTNVNLALQAKGTGAINALSRLTTIASTTGVAGLNIAPGVAPTTPVNGDLWGTTTGLFARVNGATKQLATVDGSVQISSLGTGVATALGEAVNAANGVATLDSVGGYGNFRNRLINGNFDIWQRGTSFAVADSSGPYLADRWICWNNAGVTATVSKVAAPTGFAGAQALNYTATGVAATKEFWLLQRIEAQMLADLDGKAVVLSFDMKGTTSAGSIHGVVAIASNTAVDNGTFSNLLYSTSISIPSGGARVSIAIPAANTAGLKNGAVVEIGIVQAGATGNHDITIGAVQFEADRQIAGAWGNPTAFEFRPLPVELAMSQRYYYRRTSTGADDALGLVTAYGSAAVYGKLFDFPVEMRIDNAPVSASSASFFSVYDSTITPYVVSGFGLVTASKRSLSLSGGVTVSGSPGFTAGQALTMIFNSSIGWIAVDAEL